MVDIDPGSETIGRAELVMVGTELLLGQITDTNAVYLAQRLTELGIDLHFKTTVGDNLGRIVDTVNRAGGRADLVIVVGGLGPTEDDLTRQAVAQAAGTDLEFRQDLFEAIKARFVQFGVSMTENNRRQAYVPCGSTSIQNPVGTAPAFAIEYARPDTVPALVVTLPGVPREMKYLWDNAVVPLLADRNLLAGKVIRWRSLKVCGEGESRVDSLIEDIIRSSTNPTVGLLASPGQVTIRITAKADSAEVAEKLLDAIETQIRDRLGDRIFGTGEDTLPGVICRLVNERGWRIAIVDASTGGTVISMLAPAAGHVIAGAYVLPSKDAVNGFLGDAGVAAAESAEHVCHTLAETAQSRTGADVVLALATVDDGTRVYTLGPDFEHTHEFSRRAMDSLGLNRISLWALEMLRRQIVRYEGE